MRTLAEEMKERGLSSVRVRFYGMPEITIRYPVGLWFWEWDTAQ